MQQSGLVNLLLLDFVHHQQFFNAVAVQKALGFFRVNPLAHGDEIIFGHKLADRLADIENRYGALNSSEEEDDGLGASPRNRPHYADDAELYEEGEVCLKLKIDYKHDNMNMRDPPYYRIRYSPHPHVGDKWCIYPLYDYTHGISDSIEGITHSLCTLEFEVRRDLYYWTLE